MRGWPQKDGPGSRAFNVRLQPGPGLSPSLKVRPQAGHELGHLPINPKKYLLILPEIPGPPHRKTKSQNHTTL